MAEQHLCTVCSERIILADGMGWTHQRLPRNLGHAATPGATAAQSVRGEPDDQWRCDLCHKPRVRHLLALPFPYIRWPWLPQQGLHDATHAVALCEICARMVDRNMRPALQRRIRSGTGATIDTDIDVKRFDKMIGILRSALDGISRVRR